LTALDPIFRKFANGSAGACPCGAAVVWAKAVTLTSTNAIGNKRFMELLLSLSQ
jgi:hypothetical protein